MEIRQLFWPFFCSSIWSTLSSHWHYLNFDTFYINFIFSGFVCPLTTNRVFFAHRKSHLHQSHKILMNLFILFQNAQPATSNDIKIQKLLLWLFVFSLSSLAQRNETTTKREQIWDWHFECAKGNSNVISMNLIEQFWKSMFVHVSGIFSDGHLKWMSERGRERHRNFMPFAGISANASQFIIHYNVVHSVQSA